MDEVLKAISDKEAKLTNSSSNDSSQTTTPQAEQPPVLNGRSPPPPLPVQPPRLVSLATYSTSAFLGSFSCSLGFVYCLKLEFSYKIFYILA